MPRWAELKFRARSFLGDRREDARRQWYRLPPVRRRLSRRALQAWSGETLTFVCLGNICRSPFAERVAAPHLARGRRAISAGYFPEEGRHSPEPAVNVAGRLGVDLTSHRSQVLRPEHVAQSDAIYVFDQENYRTVVREHPTARGRVHFLGALTETGPLFVEDPYGGTEEEYEQTYRRITTLVQRGEAFASRPAPCSPARR